MATTLLTNDSTYRLYYLELSLRTRTKLGITLLLELRVLGAVLITQSKFFTRGSAILQGLLNMKYSKDNFATVIRYLLIL